MFEGIKKKRRTKKALEAYQKLLDANPRHITYVPPGYPNRRTRRAMDKINRKK